MKADYESILFRIREDPMARLGRIDVHLTASYMVGYESARVAWCQPPLPMRLNVDRLREWQESKVHLCRQNLQGFSRFATDTDEEALQLFFGLYESALNDCKLDLIDQNFFIESVDASSVEQTTSLVEMLIEPIRTRPALYFGNRSWMASQWAFCNGYLEAEADMNIEASSDRKLMSKFQDWVVERYRVPKDRSWAKIYEFQSLDSNQGAFDLFFEDFELFQAGKTVDSPAKWVTEAIQKILEKEGRDKGEGTSKK
ncbi:MAG: hypothetical protein AB7V11_08680 [Pyrinomonadaceae bacterium]